MQITSLFFGLATVAVAMAAPAAEISESGSEGGSIGPATGTISGEISPTGLSGGASGNVGPSISGFFSGGVYSTDVAGCIGGVDGKKGYTTCITVPVTFAEPTATA